MKKIIYILIALTVMACEKAGDKKVIIAGDSMAYHLESDWNAYGKVCENHAVNGTLVQDLKNQVPSGERQDEILVTWSGINNYFAKQDTAVIDEIDSLYREFLTEHAPKFEKIVVMELLPTTSALGNNSNEMVPLINARLRGLEKDYANVAVMPQSENILDKEGYVKRSCSVDGIHLNDIGNEIVWKQLRKQIY